MEELVYRPATTEAYEWALPIDDAHHQFLYDLPSRPILAGWRPIRFELITKDDDRRPLLEADMPWLGRHALVLRQRAVDALAPLVDGEAELLPLICEGAELHLLHVWRTIDALDEGRSQIVRYPSSGRVMAIPRAVFDLSKLTGTRCFKLPDEYPRTIYATEQFVAATRSAGLTGARSVATSEPDPLT